MSKDSDRPKILKPAKRGKVDPKVIKAAVIEVKRAREYPKENELFNRILDVIHEYDGEISLVAALGVLELLKTELQDYE